MIARSRWPSFGAVLAIVILLDSLPADAQDSGTDPLPGDWTVSGGVVRYGTADSNCDVGSGFAAGLEATTSGSWILGAGLAVLASSRGPCTSVLPLALHEGRYVERWGGVDYPVVPRLLVRAGTRVQFSDGSIDPSVVGGLIRGEHSFGSGGVRLWRKWYGASVSFRLADLPIGLQIEHGRHNVPIWYREGGVVVHRFDQWKRFTMISIGW